MQRRIHDDPPGLDRAKVGAKLVRFGRYAIFAVVLVGSVVAVVLLSPVLLAEAVKDGVSRWAKRDQEARQATEPKDGVAKVILSKLADWGSMPLRAAALVAIASVMGLAIVVMLPLLGVTMIKNSLARHAEKQRRRAGSHLFLAQP
jgi:heme exporter protein D